jgi:hypothetical protein
MSKLFAYLSKRDPERGSSETSETENTKGALSRTPNE